MQKAVFIIGPTAVGKTQLSIKLAEHFNGAVISADSVHVYKNLSIISGKDIPGDSSFVSLKDKFKNSNINFGYYLVSGVPIYMVNLVDVAADFSVSQFFNTALLYLNNIFEQNKLTIITGGSGLYINSILNPIDTLNIKPNPKLRKRLESLEISALLEEIKRLDNFFYLSLNESERKNKRRLVRKIEILLGGNKAEKTGVKIDPLVIGLKIKKEKHNKLIKKRIKERLKTGAVAEVVNLYKNYDNLSPQVRNTIGYKEFFEYFKGEVTLKEAINNWEKSELKLVKKQNTWFKRDKRTKWFEADRSDLFEAVKSEIDAFLGTVLTHDKILLKQESLLQ